MLRGFTVDAGWLRAARPTTTGEGLTLGVARALPAGRFTFRPGVAVLAGQAISTVDSGGYDWRGIAPPYLGQTGYQDRPRLTRGGTVGAGLRLGADARLGRGLRLTGSAQTWQFSSGILGPNKAPFLAGVGLQFDGPRRRGSERAGAEARPGTRTTAAAPDTARRSGR